MICFLIEKKKKPEFYFITFIYICSSLERLRDATLKIVFGREISQLLFIVFTFSQWPLHLTQMQFLTRPWGIPSLYILKSLLQMAWAFSSPPVME